MESEQNTALSKDWRNKQIRLQQQRQQHQQHGSRPIRTAQEMCGLLVSGGLCQCAKQC
ncbi:hypothetical protein ABBQ32_013408 [Trebouxia sp. C0010 RCD-2024]